MKVYVSSPEFFFMFWGHHGDLFATSVIKRDMADVKTHFWNLGRPYDAVSVWVQDLVPKSDESESGQMVPEKVKWAWYDVYLSQTMWNQTKKSLKQLKRPNSLISHWFPVEMVHNGPKLCKRKRFFLRLEHFSEVSRVHHLKADVQGFLKMWWFLFL